jgi:heme-degrading monooxygenase HmoA
MRTVVTDIRLREGSEQTWDTIMWMRMTAAQERPGWVGGQLLRVENQPGRRVIVGTWRTRADWEAWHRDPHFAETRRQLDPLVDGPEARWWNEVVVDARVGEGAELPGAATS